jgi:DNA-directed RNA polymerase subunit H
MRSEPMKKEFDITQHSLTPKHTKLSKEEEQKFLDDRKFRKEHLPKIFTEDPSIQHLKTELGDIIKIERKSATAGVAYFYRVVSND